MTYPGNLAQQYPNKPAVVIAGTDQQIDYQTLDHRSNQIAQLLWQQGLRPGDHVAIFMENNIRYFEIVWGAVRSGLVITPINRYFTAEEAAYVVNDCGARALFVSTYMSSVALPLAKTTPGCKSKFSVDGDCLGYQVLDALQSTLPTAPLADEPRGQVMFYSSGTTGRPKGILRNEPSAPMSDGMYINARLRGYGMDEHTVYLSPAPIYHAAPLGHCMGILSLGGTVVMTPRFDVLESLAYIERYRITHSQWVPTMFVRMLKLAEHDRAQFDLSSHKLALHAAAPCPVEIKRQMIDWWGPILLEYYAGSEGNGTTVIDSEEWLAKPGSVGKARIGKLRICDDDDKELPPGQEGLVYFERDVVPFTYHNDPSKTKSAQHSVYPNWTALGDVGYVDTDGYLFLTDRKSFMIISGGVNIYPQAIENALILHPAVADVAVIGVPHEEFGESVKAVVELMPGETASDDLAQRLMQFTRDKVASYMVPRSVDFTDALPRLPTGKLYKNKVRDQYWPSR